MRSALPLLAVALFVLLPYAAYAETEPEYTDFYNTKYYYEQLKEDAESAAASYAVTPFDMGIDCIKGEMGIGINFGNVYDWNYGTNNDLPFRQRRYEFVLEIGYKSGSDDTVYYKYEQPFNAQGNLFTSENRLVPTQPYSEIKPVPASDASIGSDNPINYVRVKIRNGYYKSRGVPFKVNVKAFDLTGQNGVTVVGTSDVGTLYRDLSIPANSSGGNEVEVFRQDISTTAGDLFGENTVLRADIQLCDFISDYYKDSGLIYQHADNRKLAKKDAEGVWRRSEEMLVQNLSFLASHGIKTIRLPVTWYCHMDSTGKIDTDWLGEVTWTVSTMINNGFNVIVDIHNDTGKKGWIKADRDLFEGYTTADGRVMPGYKDTYRYLCLQIARNFREFGRQLILQGPNEVINYKNKENNLGAESDPVVSDDEFAVMNELNQIFVEEVRRTGCNNTNRVLLCNTYFSGRVNLPKFVMPSDPCDKDPETKVDDKILVGFHEYDVWQGTDVDPGMLISLRSFLKNSAFKEYPSKYNLLMDEFGIYRDKPLEERLALMNTSVPVSYGLVIPMLLWDDGARYSIMKKEKAAWDETYDSDQVAEAMTGKYLDNKLDGHIFGEPEYKWTDDRSKCTARRECERAACGHYEEETARATKTVTKEATCTEDGSTSFKAVFKNEAFDEQNVTLDTIPEATGHAPGKKVTENKVDPTCEEDGSHDEVFYCTVCNTELSRDTVTDQAIGHDYGDWVKEDDDTHKRICAHDSSHVETKEHSWNEGVVTKEPDCVEEGKRLYTCQVCNGTKEETIPAKGHSPGDKVIENEVEPKCEEDGSHDEAVYCTTCNAQLSRDTVTDPAIGHKYREWQQVDDNTHKRICEHDVNHVETKEHSWDEGLVTKEPDCVEEGTRLYTCSVCNGTREETIPANGHTPGEKVTENRIEPDHLREGSFDEAVYCSVCGKELSRKKNAIPKIPYPAGQDPDQKAVDGTSFGTGASIAAAEKAIAALTSDGDPAGTRFAPLYLQSRKQGSTSIKLTWKRVSGAARYFIYGNKCGKRNKLMKVGEAGASGKSYNVKKLAGKKLSKKTNYKFLVIAVDSKGTVVSTSKMVHAVTNGGKNGNYSKVLVTAAKTAKKGKLSLKAGKSAKIKARATGKKVKAHRKLMYESLDTSVVTVGAKNGKIKALKKGTAKVICYASNGVYKEVKVTVR